MSLRILLLILPAFLVACNKVNQEQIQFELENIDVIKSPIYWLLLQRQTKEVEFSINENPLPLDKLCQDKYPCHLSIPGNAWLRPDSNTLSISTRNAAENLIAVAESQMPDGKEFPKWRYDNASGKLKIASQEPKVLSLLVAKDSDGLNPVQQTLNLSVSSSQVVSIGPQHSQLEFKTVGSIGELFLNGVPIYSAKEFFNLDFAKVLKKDDSESRVVKDLLDKGFGQTIFEPWTKFLVQGKNRLVYRPRSLPVEFSQESVELSIRFGPGPLSRLLGPGFTGRNLHSVTFDKTQLAQTQLTIDFEIPKYVERPWQMGKAISVNSTIQDQIKIRIREAQHVIRQGNKSELQQLFRTYLQFQERIYGDDIGQRVVEYWAQLAKSPGFDFYEQGMDNLSFSLYFDDRLLKVRRNGLPALLGYNDKHEQILFPSYFILRESGLEYALD